MNLFRAVKLPPARKVETEVGALPDDRRLTKSLREEHMEVGKGMLAASRRGCILRPDGPELTTLCTLGAIILRVGLQSYLPFACHVP